MDANESPELQTGKPEGKPATGGAKTEVSASTIARMMGLPTSSDFSLLDGKLDLIATKVNALTAKLERLSTSLNSIPSASDLDRIDIQIGSLKTLIREALNASSAAQSTAAEPSKESKEQSQALRAGIRSNSTEGKE